MVSLCSLLQILNRSPFPPTKSLQFLKLRLLPESMIAPETECGDFWRLVCGILETKQERCHLRAMGYRQNYFGLFVYFLIFHESFGIAISLDFNMGRVERR